MEKDALEILTVSGHPLGAALAHPNAVSKAPARKKGPLITHIKNFTTGTLYFIAGRVNRKTQIFSTQKINLIL